MKQMTSFDIRSCISELKILEGGKVEKIYHYPPDEIRIRIYAKEKFDLMLEAGKRIHTTKFPKESPKFPSPFAMLLRKHIEGSRLVKIEQHDFDRVVLLKFKREAEKTIVAELFSKGNIVLLDEDRVVMDLKRKFKTGEIYKLPEIKKERDVVETVKFLAFSGFGGLYAEEICARAGIDKKKKFLELSSDEKERINKAISELMNAPFNPQIVLVDNQYLDVVPFNLIRYAEFEKKFFKTFNEALDEFFAKAISEEEEKLRDEELEKLNKRLGIQKESLEKFESEEERYRKIADTIYENYQLLENILNAVKSAIEKKGLEEVKKIVESGKVKHLKALDEKSVKLDLGIEFELETSKNLHENAQHYYELAKKAKEKALGVKEAIEKTLKEIEEIEQKIERKFVSSLRVRRKTEWYENYRWFFTSDGFLVIGGRNAKMNEEIVSKHLESKDLFFHTETPGAPVTILKLGQEVPETSILEAAEFAATYSALWREGKHSGDVYYVLPNQVSKAAKAGEYLSKGSFYILGKRNYLTVELNCAVGVEMEKLRVIGGPVKAIKKRADYYVELEIGERNVDELSVEIAKILAEMARDERHVVKAIAKPDEIAKFLPPGKSRIKLK